MVLHMQFRICGYGPAIANDKLVGIDNVFRWPPLPENSPMNRKRYVRYGYSRVCVPKNGC